MGVCVEWSGGGGVLAALFLQRTLWAGGRAGGRGGGRVGWMGGGLSSSESVRPCSRGPDFFVPFFSAAVQLVFSISREGVKVVKVIHLFS